MSAPRRLRAGLFAPIRLALRRPVLAILGVCLSLSAGALAAMTFDSFRSGLLAQGGGEVDEDSVWPVMSHSFPQEIDLLAPEPLLMPVATLGPFRADTPTLAAALLSATEKPLRPHDPIIEAVPSPAASTAPTMKRRKPVRVAPAQKQAENPPARSAQRPDTKAQVPRKQEQNSRREESAPEQQRLFD